MYRPTASRRPTETRRPETTTTDAPFRQTSRGTHQLSRRRETNTPASTHPGAIVLHVNRYNILLCTPGISGRLINLFWSSFVRYARPRITPRRRRLFEKSRSTRAAVRQTIVIIIIIKTHSQCRKYYFFSAESIIARQSSDSGQVVLNRGRYWNFSLRDMCRGGEQIFESGLTGRE